MFEKVSGNCTVERISALLLLQACFNFLRKINFNSRLTPSLESSHAIPQDTIGGRRSQEANHLDLGKKIIVCISNTKKLPIATTCAEATN